jgi:hypothetical protein
MAEDSPNWVYLTVQDWDYQNQADENLIKAFAKIVRKTDDEQAKQDALKQLIKWAKNEDGEVRQVYQRDSIKALVRLNGEYPELNIAKSLSRIRLDVPSNEQFAQFLADVTKVTVFREVWEGLEEGRKRQKQESYKAIIEEAAMGESTNHVQTEQTIVSALANSPFRSMLSKECENSIFTTQKRAFDFLDEMATVEQRAITTVYNLIAEKKRWQSLSPKEKADVLYAMKELFSGGIVIPDERAMGVQNDRYNRIFYLTQLYNRNMGETRKNETLVNLTVLGIREGDFELATTALRTLKENLSQNRDRRLRGINDVLPLVALEQDEKGTFYKDLATIVERALDETVRRDNSYDAVLHQIYRLLDSNCNPQILHEVAEYAMDERGIVPQLCTMYEKLAKSIAEGEKTYEKAKEAIEQFLEVLEPLLQQLPSEPKSEAFLAAKDTFTSMERLMNNYLLDGISDINLANLDSNLLKLRGISHKDSPVEAIQQNINSIKRKVEELNHQIEAFIQIDFKLIRDEEKMLNEIELTLEEIQRRAASLPPVEAHLFSGILNGWKEDWNKMYDFFRELRIALAEHDEEKISQMPYSKSIPEHRKREKEAILAKPATQKSITEFWQFKVRWLVGRYDLERAFKVARNSPEALELIADSKIERSRNFNLNSDYQSEHPLPVEYKCPIKEKPPRRLSLFLWIAALLLVIPYITYPILGVLELDKAYGVPVQIACILIIISLFAVPFSRLELDKATASVLLLPRLLAATGITYFVLALGSEIWGFAILLSGKGILPAVVLSAGACLGYTFFEIKRTAEVKTFKRAFKRAWKVVVIGLLQSYIIGFCVTTFLGKTMVEAWAVGINMKIDEFAHQTVLGIPKMLHWQSITVFPTILMLSTFTILFVGLFLELLKEKREITEEF